MKNNSLIIKSAILALCAMSLMACSLKVDGKKPQPPAKKPVVVTSAQNQALKVTNETHEEDQRNELIMVKPVGAMSFFFEYKPERKERLYFPAQKTGIETFAASSPTGCNKAQIGEAFTWLEIIGDQVVNEIRVIGNGHSILVEPGQHYKLKASYTGLWGCETVGRSFVITSEEVKDVSLGGEVLEIEKPFTIAPARTQREDSMYYDMPFISATERHLYFSYVSEQTTDDCPATYSQSMEWIELGADGNVVRKKAISDFSNFTAKAETKHVLRVWFKNTRTCSFINVGFKVTETR